MTRAAIRGMPAAVSIAAARSAASAPGNVGSVIGVPLSARGQFATAHEGDRMPPPPTTTTTMSHHSPLSSTPSVVTFGAASSGERFASQSGNPNSGPNSPSIEPTAMSVHPDRDGRAGSQHEDERGQDEEDGCRDQLPDGGDDDRLHELPVAVRRGEPERGAEHARHDHEDHGDERDDEVVDEPAHATDGGGQHGLCGAVRLFLSGAAHDLHRGAGREDPEHHEEDRDGRLLEAAVAAADLLQDVSRSRGCRR